MAKMSDGRISGDRNSDATNVLPGIANRVRAMAAAVPRVSDAATVMHASFRLVQPADR